MVKHEIRVRHEIHRDRHVVQAVRVERVLRLEHRVKVVRVPVISDKAKHRDPHVRLHDVTLAQRFPSIARARAHQRRDDRRRRARAAIRQVPPTPERLVRPRRDHHPHARDPARRVLQAKHLPLRLARARLRAREPPRAARRRRRRRPPPRRLHRRQRRVRRQHRRQDRGEYHRHVRPHVPGRHRARRRDRASLWRLGVVTLARLDRRRDERQGARERQRRRRRRRPGEARQRR